MQEESFNHKAPTIIVAAITTVIKKTYLRSHIYLGDSFCLPKPSMVLLEQIRSVNKSEFKEFIGYIDDGKVWAEINSALKKTFGLWLYNPERTGSIRTLCGKCLKKSMKKPDLIVKRLDPLSMKKDVCEVCHDEAGYDYFIFDKRLAVGKGRKYESGR